jgi:hypothetical protein
MKLYGGANILKGGDIPRNIAPLLRGGANLLGGGENPVTPGLHASVQLLYFKKSSDGCIKM